MKSAGGQRNGDGLELRIPCATYRLQFNRHFTFNDAAGIIDYLEELGITDIYASPLFQASAESTHGYDVCDYGAIHCGLGEAGAFQRFTEKLKGKEIGLLLDMVPNHMRADVSNPWFADVLEKGRGSQHATWFDIDWNHPDEDLKGKVLLPVLEASLEEVLAAGKIQLAFERGQFVFTYYSNRFPVAAESYDALFEQITSRRHAASQPTPAGFNSVKETLSQWCKSSEDCRKALDQLLQTYNQGSDHPAKLKALLAGQHFVLTYWKSGLDRINYRRFFDVSSLVCVNVQNPETFEAAHRLLRCLVQKGTVTGVRVDHPDGLWNPREYFERLQQLAGGPGNLYVVAEKILSGHETLRPDWPVAGTTGYDFLNVLNGVFVDVRNEARLSEVYTRFTGQTPRFHDVVEQSKRFILVRAFRSETRALAETLRQLALQAGLSFTADELVRAVIEVIVALPVYRTYVTETDSSPGDEDQRLIVAATNIAEEKLQPERAVVFLRSILLLRPPDGIQRAESVRFVMRFQQLTGPAMAKGLEDTAFYYFNRLISLNEVGGEPGVFGRTVEQFHEHNQFKATHWPHSLLATATHDTKRGEDARARINVLSEIPAQWQAAVLRWASANAACKQSVDGVPVPDRNDEYLFYQTLLGAAPFGAGELSDKAFIERMSAYMLKAIREAKVHTSWTEQNATYENATTAFVGKVLHPANKEFLSDFVAFHRDVAFFGQYNSCSQLILKATSPGVPDFYQGTELWDFSLVDPDNRRPVDYHVRRQALAELKGRCARVNRAELIRSLLEEPESGLLKLFFTWKALEFRRAHHDLFSLGSYRPLSVTGSKSRHVIAFARAWQGKQVVVVVPRLIAELTEGDRMPPLGREIWGDTALFLGQGTPKRLRNIFADEELVPEALGGSGGIEVGSILATTPVAILEGIEG